MPENARGHGAGAGSRERLNQPGPEFPRCAVLLSRIRFAFAVSFHIIFPAFTIGLGAWLAVLERMHLATKPEVYARLFAFWLKIFAVAFGLGVVSGIVMAFQFGSDWSEVSRRTGPIQGPLLAYESFTAFARCRREMPPCSEK